MMERKILEAPRVDAETDIFVQGAGMPEYNGWYRRRGVREDRPLWRQVGGENAIFFRVKQGPARTGATHWCICPRDKDGYGYYYNQCDTPTPRLGHWQAGTHVRAPAPTIESHWAPAMPTDVDLAGAVEESLKVEKSAARRRVQLKPQPPSQFVGAATSMAQQWVCSVCGQSNFQSRPVCRGRRGAIGSKGWIGSIPCTGKRPLASPAEPSTQSDPEWTCSQCGQCNFAARNVCRGRGTAWEPLFCTGRRLDALEFASRTIHVVKTHMRQR